MGFLGTVVFPRPALHPGGRRSTASGSADPLQGFAGGGMTCGAADRSPGERSETLGGGRIPDVAEFILGPREARTPGAHPGYALNAQRRPVVGRHPRARGDPVLQSADVQSRMLCNTGSPGQEPGDDGFCCGMAVRQIQLRSPGERSETRGSRGIDADPGCRSATSGLQVRPHGEERASWRASRTMGVWSILRDAAKRPLLRMRPCMERGSKRRQGLAGELL
jgi:hypothetical protein